jgi:hypothetical protein
VCSSSAGTASGDCWSPWCGIPRTASAYEELKAKHAELQRHCSALEDRLQLYATAINALTLENAAMAGRTAGSAKIVPLTRQWPAS